MKPISESSNAEKLLAALKRQAMTRTQLRGLAHALFGVEAGNRAYNSIIFGMPKNGLVEIIKNGERAKIGFAGKENK